MLFCCFVCFPLAEEAAELELASPIEVEDNGLWQDESFLSVFRYILNAIVAVLVNSICYCCCYSYCYYNYSGTSHFLHFKFFRPAHLLVLLLLLLHENPFIYLFTALTSRPCC